MIVPDRGRMCLIITVTTRANNREAIESVSRRLGNDGLTIKVEHVPRWPWARERPVRFTISEDGTCSCSLLGDDADWNAEVWAFRPEVLNRFALTVEGLTDTVQDGVTLEALWVGEMPLQTMTISPGGLAELIRTNRLGTRTRYEVVSQSPGLL